MLLAYLPNCLTFPPSFHPHACGSGVAADVIPNLKRDFGVAIVDLMFLDHSAASYVSDVAVASAQNFLAAGDDQTPFLMPWCILALRRHAGSRVVANHVLFPGVSGYTDAMNR